MKNIEINDLPNNIKTAYIETPTGISEVSFIDYNGEAMFQFDISLGKTEEVLEKSLALEKVVQSSITTKTDLLWTNKIVPYKIDLTHPKKAMIEEAIAQFNSQIDVKFEAWTSQANYVEFICTDKCSSKLGMRGGMQTIEIPDRKEIAVGNIMHEMMHTVGVFHEHTRNDRDTYIKVHLENLEFKEWEVNFKIQPTAKDFGSYDYDSIMHYGTHSGAKSGGDAVIEVIQTTPIKIGQRDHLSTGDIAGVKELYKAITK